MSVSSHVLDTANGQPVLNIKVVFEKNLGTSSHPEQIVWNQILETRSNNDGRLPDLKGISNEVRYAFQILLLILLYVHLSVCKF